MNAAAAKHTSQWTFDRPRSFTFRNHAIVFSQPNAGSCRSLCRRQPSAVASAGFHVIVQQHGGHLAFRTTVGGARHGIDDETMAVFDDEMAEISEPRFVRVPLRYSFASGSVVDAWVSLVRASP